MQKVPIYSILFKNYDVNIVSAFALSSSNLLRPTKDVLTIKKVLNYSLNKTLKQNSEFKIEFIYIKIIYRNL